jgi:hypothetical protein
MSHNAPQAAQRNFEPLTQFDSMQLQGKPTGTFVFSLSFFLYALSDHE